MADPARPEGERPDGTGTKERFRGVARYYDLNTLPFLILGRSGSALALHRRLWGPGVENGRDAFRYIHSLIVEELASHGPPPLELVDLGCGVGGTVFELAERLPGSRLHGVTLSVKQHRLATRMGRRKGLSHRCRFVRGDFHEIDLDVRADAVVAVESFVHARSPGAFLAAAGRHLRQGGLLVLADDFVTAEPDELDPRRRELVEDFRAGWRLESLCTSEAFRREARRSGFHELAARDLTHLIATDRWRDRLVHGASRLARGLRLGNRPLASNLLGGDALHTGLKEGIFRYRLVVLRKGAGPGAGTSVS